MFTWTDVIKDGHPTLRMRAENVALPLSEEDKQLGQDMLAFLKNTQDPAFIENHGGRPGIGLAAPQLNILKRIIAVHLEQENDESISDVFFNPRIISHSVEKTYITKGEGCLSIDEECPGFVPRHAKVKVKAINLNGEEIILPLTGLASVCFQHEIDHLNGILFYDHIDKERPFGPIPDAVPLER